MALVTGIGLVSGIDLYSVDTTPNHQIGQIVWDGNAGKAFRYALVGASNLVMGNLLQEQVRDTQFENMAIGTAGAAGDAFFQVTNGTTTVVPATYRGGSISVYTAGTIAIGDEYTVTDITGTLTSGGALKVYTDRPLRAAVTTSAKVVLKPSPWAGVIQFPASTPTGMAVGVALTAATAANYTWVQTHGVASVLSDGQTFATGSNVGTASATAGSVTVFAAGTTHQLVGVAREVQALGSAINIFLKID